MDSKIKPVIVSFYTQEYEQLADRMIASAKRFGYETRVLKIAKVNGSWLQTIYVRPTFIRQMLQEVGRPVVWLDCDAIIEQDPSLFEDFKGDFGIHIKTWPASRPGPQVEYLGGTMYFAHNERVIDFLDKWIWLNVALPVQKLSQWVIPHALEESPGLKVVQLPATYTQIFDSMKGDGGAPVISHHQASRRFRDG